MTSPRYGVSTATILLLASAVVPSRAKFGDKQGHRSPLLDAAAMAGSGGSGADGGLAAEVCKRVPPAMKRCCELYVSHPTMRLESDVHDGSSPWGDLPKAQQGEWARAQCEGSGKRVRSFRTIAGFVKQARALAAGGAVGSVAGAADAARWCTTLVQKFGKPRAKDPAHAALVATWGRLSCTAAHEAALAAYDASMRARVAALPPKPAGERRVISFGLYGAAPRYTDGMLRNVQLAPTWFPGWDVRVYADDSVPPAVLAQLRELGAEILTCDLRGGIGGMFCRFFVADDPTVDRYLIRDSDSRLNGRDRLAVEEWIESGKGVHALRDHPGHGSHHINGGMWGGVKGAIKDLRGQALAFGKFKHKWADMDFLDKVIWPQVKDDTLAHDSYTCEKFPGSRPFPTRRNVDFEFVGQVWMTKFVPRQRFIDCCMRGKPAPLACRKKPEWDNG